MDAIKHMWQVPYICQFVKLFRGSLNMDVIIPEELEQALLTPDTSPLAAELFTKLLLKKGAARRELPPGEGHVFEKWHSMFAKQLTQWHSIHERFQKIDSLDKFSAAQRLAIRMFQELGGNPFVAPPKEEEQKTTPQPAAVSHGTRETRSQTNSLPRARKLKYIEDYEQSSDLDDEDKIRGLHEISPAHRVIVLYYLCAHKMETDEELVHELNYVPLEQQRVQPLGKDSETALYYYFNNYDCRIYKELNGEFSLVAKTIDQVKELVCKLETIGSYELARLISRMLPDLQANEQERNKRMLANIRKFHNLPGKKLQEVDNDDSDFSPVDEEFNGEKRGPGRPRKFQIPERKPKVMPSTNGDELVFIGILKKIETITEILYSFTGDWQLPNNQNGAFKFLKYSSQDPSGVYSGFWEYSNKSIEETLELNLNSDVVSGCGENMFGLFKIDGVFEADSTQPVAGEVVIGRMTLRRLCLKLDLNDDESSCSEADPEEFDGVKPPFKLEFEQKVHFEHMKMPRQSAGLFSNSALRRRNSSLSECSKIGGRAWKW